MPTISLDLKQNGPSSMQLVHEQFAITVDRPIEKGGTGKGLMGGQYLLAGIGGCFCSTLFAAAASRDVSIEGLEVKVLATLSEDLPKRFTDVSLEVSCQKSSDEEQFSKLIKIAEKGCISINTVKHSMRLTIKRN